MKVEDVINNNGGIWKRHDKVNVVKTRKPIC